LATKPKTIDEFLATVDGEKGVALEKLRQTIRSAAPKAEECISYGVPAFKQNGLLVAFGAWKDHCAFYPGASLIEQYKDELKNFSTSKGTIRFKPGKPIPAGLVRKIVKARVAENLSKRKKT
jgi:uncharacterized protein YdhG (YjbR/CyaY superfamily)